MYQPVLAAIMFSKPFFSRTYWNQINHFSTRYFGFLNWDRVSLMSPWTRMAFGNEISFCKLVKSYWAFYMTLNSCAIKITHSDRTSFKSALFFGCCRLVFLIFFSFNFRFNTEDNQTPEKHNRWIFNPNVWNLMSLRILMSANINKQLG